MGLVRSRSLYPWIGVVLFLFLGSGRADAGCHTACNTAWWPNCMNCSFTAFSNILCYRASCGECEEISCSAALPAQEDQWASSGGSQDSCSAATRTAPTVRLVKVQILNARS